MSLLRQKLIPGVAWILFASGAAVFGARLDTFLGDILLYGGGFFAAMSFWEVLRVLRLNWAGAEMLKAEAITISTPQHILAAFEKERRQLLWAYEKQLNSGEITREILDSKALNLVMRTNTGEDPSVFDSLVSNFYSLEPQAPVAQETVAPRLTKKNLTEADIDAINFGRHYYLMNYDENYSDFIDTTMDRERVLSELFLFRGWTTQFGFRVFNSQQHLVDSILNHIVSSMTTLGVGLFTTTHGVDPREVLGGRLIDLIEERWQADDRIVENSSADPPIPTMELIETVKEYMNVRTPEKAYLLASDFLTQLNEIKKDANDIGLI